MSDLASATWPRLGERPMVMVPVGSTEQHGPHLPLTTDTIIAEAVAERVAARLREDGIEVRTAPPIHYGSSGEHQGFPGTMSIGNDAPRLVLVELVRSLASWAGRIVFVNAHGGNGFALSAAVAQLMHEQHDVGWVPCATEQVDAHAGHTETSLLLCLAPELVDMGAAEPGNTTPIGELLPDLVADGVRAVSSNGVLGDPTTATEPEGRKVLAGLVADVHDRIVAFDRDDHGRLERPERTGART